MGCIITNREDIHERLRFLQNAIGAVPSPFDCFLVNRGIKTLAVRMERHQENGLKIARFLESNPQVQKVGALQVMNSDGLFQGKSCAIRRYSTRN